METVEKEGDQQNKIPENSVNRTEDRKTKFELEQEKVSDWYHDIIFLIELIQILSIHI